MRRNFIKKNDAITLLNEGWELFNSRNKHYGAKNQLIYSSLTWVISYPNKPDRNIHHSTISALKKDGIIQSNRPYRLIKSKKQ